VPDPSTQPTPASLRLFVAIELPGDVREALTRLQHELQRRGLERLRWVRPEGIHLTLKFLGPTPAEKVPAIKQALVTAVEGTSTHELTVAAPSWFYRGRTPSVLKLDLGGNIDELRSVQRRIEEELEKVGVGPEARAFTPHLTLARVPDRAALGSGTSFLRGFQDRGVRQSFGLIRGIIPVREVSLMRSTLRPTGAVYERIAAFPLARA